MTDKAVSITNFNIDAFTKMKLSRLRKVRERNNHDHTEFQTGRITKAVYDNSQMYRGRNWKPADILNPRYQLDLPDVIMYDWSHMCVHDGAADVEFGLCMSFMQKDSKHGTSFAELGRYVQLFRHPKSAPGLTHLF